MRIPENHWLRTTKIAHRGLWGGAVPENSTASFKAAIQAGFAIETDVHLTADGQLIVHHDSNTLRQTGVKHEITETDLATLKTLFLDGTQEKLITLSELLEILNGQIPLMLEIKANMTNSKEIAQAVHVIMKDYKGEFAVQAFNPLAVKWFKKNEPSWLRGQLSCSYSDQKGFAFYLGKTLFFNRMTKPDFVDYDQADLPNKYVDKAKKQGKLIITYTITTPEREKELKGYYDNLIFEHYLPENKNPMK